MTAGRLNPRSFESAAAPHAQVRQLAQPTVPSIPGARRRTIDEVRELAVTIAQQFAKQRGGG